MPACAISRVISGMHEPQLVPAFTRAPISLAVPAPAAMAAQTVPTPKQAQTTGPGAGQPVDRFTRQQHPALIVAELVRSEQVLDRVPVAGIARRPHERAGLDAIFGKRCRAKNTAAEIPVFGEIAAGDGAQP